MCVDTLNESQMLTMTLNIWLHFTAGDGKLGEAEKSLFFIEMEMYVFWEVNFIQEN